MSKKWMKISFSFITRLGFVPDHRYQVIFSDSHRRLMLYLKFEIEIWMLSLIQTRDGKKSVSLLTIDSHATRISSRLQWFTSHAKQCFSLYFQKCVAWTLLISFLMWWNLFVWSRSVTHWTQVIFCCCCFFWAYKRTNFLHRNVCIEKQTKTVNKMQIQNLFQCHDEKR